MRKTGVRTQGPIGECMVVGCNRRARYRNGNTRIATGRGYCSTHKRLAEAAGVSRCEAALKEIEWREANPSGWRLNVADADAYEPPPAPPAPKRQRHGYDIMITPKAGL